MKHFNLLRLKFMEKALNRANEQYIEYCCKIDSYKISGHVDRNIFKQLQARKYELQEIKKSLEDKFIEVSKLIHEELNG